MVLKKINQQIIYDNNSENATYFHELLLFVFQIKVDSLVLNDYSNVWMSVHVRERERERERKKKKHKEK